MKDEDIGDDDDHDSTSDQQQQIITIVSSPRCPSDSWLRELSTRMVTFLAHRSPELRNMIIMESPFDNDNSNHHHHSGSALLVQILLPELHRVAAKALIYYLYMSVEAIVIVRHPQIRIST